MIALIAARMLLNARSDFRAAGSWWRDLSPGTRKWIVRLALIVAGYFVHQHYAHKALSAAASAARAAQRGADQAVLDKTVANYRAAAVKAAAEDKANADRVRTEQTKINQEAVHDFEVRIAAARAAAERLRQQLASAAHPGSGAATPVPSLPTAGGASQAPGEDRFSIADRLLATEQSIQLDELIKAARKVMAIDPNGAGIAADREEHRP